jgi:predicted lipoprotein with Yx(FWY)xxD motif
LRPSGRAVKLWAGVLAALLGWGAAPALAQEPARVEMTADGPILVTPAGMSLYMNGGEDVSGEKFAWKCTNVPPTRMDDQQSGLGERKTIGAEFQRSCVEKFPPYLAAAGAQPSGDFTLIDRPEGGRQWVYRNFPLYTSVRDRKPGDRGGGVVGRLFGAEGRSGQFRLAQAYHPLPASLKFLRREAGLVLAYSAGAGDDRPLFTPRGKHRPGLNDGFQIVMAPDAAKPAGEWSIVDAGAGRRQYAYRGKRLYTAPTGLEEFEIAAAGLWEPVVVVPDPGRPEAIGKHVTLLGDVFTTSAGTTLYTYNCSAGGVQVKGDRYVECDGTGDPAGYMVASCGVADACASRWRPYLAPASARPVGDWSIIDITYPMFTDPRGRLYPADAPRVKTWAYRGRPLFTFHEDKQPGDIWGDASQGLWGSGFFALRTHDPGFE